MFNAEENLSLADKLLKKLFPICRSITGKGNRTTLSELSEYVPLKIHEVKSGTSVFDWTVPDEWNIQDAWIKDSQGNKIVDFQKSNLSVVNYSTPLHEKLSFSELDKHLHTLPNNPDAIPYRTSYYKKTWGFCLTYNQYLKLDRNATYEVFIDSHHDAKGSLTFADALHKGKSKQEILLSTYCCHPSLANDNLSGMILSVLLFRYLSTLETEYSYRLVIAPETIGVITYLFSHQTEVSNIAAGAVITTVAGKGALGLKPSFQGNHWVDRISRSVLNETTAKWVEYPFVPDGSDERQYASPGFRIPTVSITKDKYYEYPEYHTSLDNLQLVTAEQLLTTLKVYVKWFEAIEANRTYSRKMPFGEYQLGKRGLYPQLGGSINQGSNINEQVSALEWTMFGCDGKTDLLSLSEKSKLPIKVLFNAAQSLYKAGLLEDKTGALK